MVLSSEQAIKLIQDKVNHELVAKAIAHEERIRFHSQLCTDASDTSSYYKTFLSRIEKILPKDKYLRFTEVFDFPVPTTDLVDVVFSELSKVFDAQNKNLSYQFSRPESREDFTNYLEWMEFSQFWENECFEAIRNRVNTIQVVDMAIIKGNGKPQPYVFNLNIERVIAIEINDDGNISFLAYKDQGRIVSIDENYYRTYNIDGEDLKSITIHIENRHLLGYAPARFLMTDNIGKSKMIKQSPISKALWALDRLLFRIISGENLEDYAAYPIYSIYDEDCNFKDVHGNTCQGGKITGINQGGIDYVVDCPSCKDNFYMGPGSILTSKAPRTKDQADLLDQVKITSADVESLEYINGAVDRRKSGILFSCVGFDPESQTGKAQNEIKVISTYDSRQSILMKLKRNIEKAKKFVIDTIAALRYGQSYLGCTVDEGSRFYLATSQQLTEKLADAKANGASQFEIAMIKNEIYSNEYRNNPEQLQRIEILKRLEPFCDLSFDQVVTLKEKFPLNDLDLFIKFNFDYFVCKFEDENGSITDFGALLPMSERIEIIKNQLFSYGNREFKQQPIIPAV
ncbi:hypothetical protein [Pedobacter agri]|uniref:Uncharacterized protein n=1 Tax=Pedobacter agri TaxID=454586 RepID=A0A9X3I8H0_9SPHI|nr:hypothetical protein [Pedobacter agri]MCX3264807.1 hypothetical protein [Pedobacter agri]